MESLKDRAVLVKFTDRVWVGGTRDNKVSAEIEEANDAKKGTGHYWKQLVPKVALKDRINVSGNARNFHDKNTNPWLGGGVRILPAANFTEYMAGMRKLQAEADAAVSKFCSEYVQWIAEAKKTQGRLFKAEQYPDPSTIANKFGFKVDVMPLPNIADWRVDLSEDQVKTLRAEAEQRYADVQKEGVMELYERLQKLLDRAQKKLSDKEAVFRDSLIGNVKDMVGVIARLNVTNDPGLEAIRKETEEKLVPLSPETLRLDPDARNSAATTASSIMSKMAAYMGTGKIVIPQQETTSTKKKNAKSKVTTPKKKALTQEQKDRKNKAARERRAGK